MTDDEERTVDEAARGEGASDPDGGSGEESAAVEDGGQGLEARLRRLEAIVSALDSDALELEHALALFEEGVGHVRKAQEILSEAELKVEELIGRVGAERRELPVDDNGP